ncbi:hypothetical protein [Methylobacter sp.]|uniref:hypothetical protein n=1 Tax=Methylobacter sp. TaxID=2051955 RepID=UPI001211492D|nr:hypothetical protein [Methylobacter sp.]TAK62091.1 MAG: hypothetical protein EPO18_11765 [Methylobacter sp.]
MIKRIDIALLTGALLVSAAVFAEDSEADKQAETTGTAPQAQNTKESTPPTPPQMDCPSTVTVSSTLPLSVANTFPQGYQAFNVQDQPCFDMFSWQVFAALNWPADSNGNPESGANVNIGTDPGNFRVWEYFDDTANVFGSSSTAKKGSATAEKFPGGVKIMGKLSKVDGSPGSPLSEFIEASGQPMVDNNLNYLVYEVRLNPTEVSYIMQNGLNTKKGQQTAPAVFFPTSVLPTQTAPGAPGSMEIKAAWKILSGNDQVSQFYTRQATINVDKAHSVSGKAFSIKNVTVGLVGMHILYKPSSFGWIWSTFEQVNNAPDINDLSANTNYAGKNLYNHDCSSSTCFQNILNKQKTYKWSATAPYAATAAFNDGKGNAFGTQTVRMVPIPDYTQAINALWQYNLSGTVWANYQLIGSQWLGGTENTPAPNSTFGVPHALSNMTMETYDQASASCISCHNMATTTAGKPADFSFLLQHAK